MSRSSYQLGSIHHTLSNNRVTCKPLSFFTMANKKNTRKRVPTEKKLAADPVDNSNSPPHLTSTQPKPRLNYRGSTKDPKPARASRAKVLAPVVQTSKKAIKHGRSQSVTSIETDASKQVDTDAREDEVIEMDEEEDGNWDEEDEPEKEDCDEEDEDLEVKCHHHNIRKSDIAICRL